MKLETKYGIGDIVYVASPDRYTFPLTIGQVTKSITDSPGIPEQTRFDNYKPQKSCKEEYMCIETGIGAGSLYRVDRVFATQEEATKKLHEMLKRKE